MTGTLCHGLHDLIQVSFMFIHIYFVICLNMSQNNPQPPTCIESFAWINTGACRYLLHTTTILAGSIVSHPVQYCLQVSYFNILIKIFVTIILCMASSDNFPNNYVKPRRFGHNYHTVMITQSGSFQMFVLVH